MGTPRISCRKFESIVVAFPMAALAPAFSAATLEKYKGAKPINFRLLLVNLLLIGGCSFVIFASISRYNIVLNDFDRIARTDATSAIPCGAAVPRIKFVLEALHEIADGSFAEVIEDDYVTRVSNALCSTNEPTNAIRAALQAKEIVEHDPDDTNDPSVSETSVTDYLCSCKSSSCNAKHSGDFLRRVTHAYVLSAPAFERFRGGNVGSDTCMLSNNPFSDASCANAVTVNAQLQLAAVNSVNIIAGGSESFPPTSEMLYRLLALGSLEFFDRRLNAGGCFKNTDQKSAIDFCTDLMVKTTDLGTATTGGISNASQQIYYAGVSTSAACDWDTNDAASTNPSMPTRRDRKFNDSYRTAKPAIAVCMSTLELGWLGRKRLMGLPDPVSEATWYPENRGSGFSRWLAGWTYWSLYDANKGKAETNDVHTAFLDLKLYVGYRFAATTAWVIAACIAASYMLFFALVPFSKLVFIRLIRRQLTSTPTDTIMTRPLTTGAIVALVTSILVGLWVVFVDGVNVPYVVDTVCDDYDIAGGPYVTTDERAPDGILGLVLIVLGTGLLIFMGVCRRTPKRQRVMPLAPFSLWPMLALLLILLIAGLILMVDAGNRWWTRESTNVDGSDSKTTKDFEEIIGVILWGVLLLAALTGLLSQRHMAANVMLNVPVGKLPTFALLYVGTGVALAVIAAVFLWPLFDCQLQWDVNEITCGDGVEVKVRWARFWGCIGWGASVIAIVFVVFGAYKILFTTPRKNDPTSAAFNRSKDAELRLLGEKRATKIRMAAEESNQRRFDVAPAPWPPPPRTAAVATGGFFSVGDTSSSDESDIEETNPTPERFTFRLDGAGATPMRTEGAVAATFVVGAGGLPRSC